MDTILCTIQTEEEQGHLGREPEGDQLTKQEEKETGDTSLNPYIDYLKQNKGFLYCSFAALSHLTFIAGQILGNTWMVAKSIFVVILGLQASKSFFSELITSLFREPVSLFDSTPLGRILSRVSLDLSILDVGLPFNFIFTISSSLNAYSNLGVIAVVTWQVLFVALPMIYLTFHVQRLELLSAIVLSSSAIAMVVLPAGTFNPGFVGMAISYGLSLNTSLFFSVQNQCTLANYIMSIECIKHYMHIPSEAPTVIEDSQPPIEWPSHGEVELQNLKDYSSRANSFLWNCSLQSGPIARALRFGTLGESTYLEAFLMECYFDEVCAKSLSYINQGGYKMNPFPLADLAELLMMEEPDMENFYTLCGLLTSTDDRGVKFLMVKQVNFRLPQKGFPQYNCPLISRK
eukprot:Gb_23689 [translate_table: standard]